ncbi:hypothetical protein GGR57DRAFT_494529 [Xylariaceae sp. FL1272]|nr:hypothetical protein GGR57DRAFT_494529 [Xylariaceae sp. FL1272]
MVISWIATIGFCTVQFLHINEGGGKHIQDVSASHLKNFSKLFQDSQLVARTAIFFARLSILLLYIRIFFPLGTDRTAFWWLIILTIVANFLYTLSLIFATTLQCVPYGLPFGSTCLNQYLVLILASTINIISDVAVLVIPIASIWKLQMSRERKLATWSLFAFAVAMITGSAPICWGLARRLIRGRSIHPPHGAVSISQRMWPAREAKDDQRQRRSRTFTPPAFRSIDEITRPKA